VEAALPDEASALAETARHPTVAVALRPEETSCPVSLVEKPPEPITGPVTAQRADVAAEVNTSADADGPVPIAVAVNFHRVLVEGHANTLQVSLENLGMAEVGSLVVQLSGSGLAAPLELSARRLGPGRRLVRTLEPELRRAGNMVLLATVSGRVGETSFQLRGELPMRVLREPSRQGDIRIEIKDLVRFEGTNAGLGAELEKIDLGGLVPESVFTDLNALLNHELADDFRAFPLEPDIAVSRRAGSSAGAGPSIPTRFLNTAAPARRLRLVPVASGDQARELRLVSGPRFVLGRSRAEADFLTWFWPRDEARDEQTRQLGKTHAALEIRSGRVWVRDLASANGTWLDGTRLTAGAPALLRERGLLNLGGTYALDVRHDAGETLGAPAGGDAGNQPGPAAPEPPASGETRAATGAVRCVPRDGELALWDAVWVITAAAFGCGAANPIRLALPGVAETQGRFHHWRGGFWLDQAREDGAVVLDGRALRAGELAPLAAGRRLRLGAVEFDIELEA
jgi:hypothetical protein